MSNVERTVWAVSDRRQRNSSLNAELRQLQKSLTKRLQGDHSAFPFSLLCCVTTFLQRLQSLL